MKQPDKARCPWAKTELYVQYHDTEWAVSVHDDRLLFEFLILEGAQVGLSWETILKKRENYRRAFDTSYTCDSCGEEIVVPIDLSAGSEQEYVEDCPVCCCPSVVHVEIDEDGDVRVWAERE